MPDVLITYRLLLVNRYVYDRSRYSDKSHILFVPSVDMYVSSLYGKICTPVEHGASESLTRNETAEL